MDLLHLLENAIDRKHISANPNHNCTPNPNAQQSVRTNEMTSFCE